jgi:hypothetical protein
LAQYVIQLQEQFYQMMTRLQANSIGALTQASKDDTRLTEMIKGILESRQAKKEGKPQVIDLQEYAEPGKAVSVSKFSINNCSFYKHSKPLTYQDCFF